jgi:ABC-2 type transport system permease protein
VRPPLRRLARVELRKAADTRAGSWLLAVTGALTVVVAVVACLVFHARDRTLLNLLAVSLAPASLVLPVAGILLVTSEWSQRTALITFALVPARARVVAGKLLAGLALALGAGVICGVVAVVATAFAGAAGPHTWTLSAGLVAQAAIAVTVPMLIGLGFGACLLSSAPAIVLYFVLPTAWSALGSIHTLRGAARWLDQNRTTTPLVDHALSATEWERLAVSLALWLALPLAVGLWRVARADVR